MGKILNARIDDETLGYLEALQRSLELSESQLVRDGLRVLAMVSLPPAQKKLAIAGLGRFTSGKSDLASNKKHLKGFGR